MAAEDLEPALAFLLLHTTSARLSLPYERNRLNLTENSRPLLPLLLVLVLNLGSFFLFEKVGTVVGALTGTDGYKETAENLVKGYGLTSAPATRSTIELGYMKREPVYPVLLAAILRVTGSLSPGVLCVLHTLLSLISCYLLYRLGEKIFSPSAAWWAAFVYALHPISFWYSTRFASEVVAVPVLLFSLLLIERFFDEPNYTRAVQVGLSFGLATLTRNACVVLLPLFILFTLIKWRMKVRTAVAYALPVILLHVAIQSGWVIRNYLISGEIVPFTTNSGGVFFIGNKVVEQYETKTQTSKEEQAEDAAQALYKSVQNTVAASMPGVSLPRLEATTDKELSAMVRHFVLHRPLFVARKIVGGMYFIWFLSNTPEKSWGWMAVQMPLLALAVLGVFRCRPNLIRTFLVCVAVTYVLPYAFFLALARYSMPIIPIVILFASYGFVSMLRLKVQPSGSMEIHSSSAVSV